MGKNYTIIRRCISCLVLCAFVANTIFPFPLAYAQTILKLPAPVTLKGLTVYLQNPFKFDFIVDEGDAPRTNDDELKSESTKLIKYFLAALATPSETCGSTSRHMRKIASCPRPLARPKWAAIYSPKIIFSSK